MKFLKSISKNKYIFISILALIAILICIRLVLNKENLDDKDIESCERSFLFMSNTLSINNYNEYIKCLESIPSFEEYDKCSDHIDAELDKKFGFPN